MITATVQRWNHGKARYRPAGVPILTSEYDVAEVTEAQAKAFVLRHHYSGTYPAARRRFGLFCLGALVGVAVFSHPCNDKAITNVFGCERASDGLELGRFVLLDSVPANGESWFLARCRAALKDDYVGVVSFSDDTPRLTAAGAQVFGGHIGTIYQASNAAFLGRGTARTLYVLPDGRTMNARALQKIRTGERGSEYAAGQLQAFGAAEITGDPRLWLQTWLPQIVRRIHHPGNLRYAWSFSRSVMIAGQPYPKVKGVI